MLAATAATGAYDIMLPTSPDPVTLPASGTATILASNGDAGPLPGIVLAGSHRGGHDQLGQHGTLSLAAGQTLGLKGSAERLRRSTYRPR